VVRRLHSFIADTDILIFEVFYCLLIMQKKKKRELRSPEGLVAWSVNAGTRYSRVYDNKQ
jgi:hypothetical protein